MKLNKLGGDKEDWKIKILAASKMYCFQKELTKKLDEHEGDFTEYTLLEIVLWKTNRYPEITNDLLSEINDLRRVYGESKAKTLLTRMLQLKGFDLPMASAVLRFALPSKFQIIDKRVYRIITAGEDTLKIPRNVEAKIELYFKYLKRLREVCSNYEIAFEKADRILYQLDKTENRDVAINY